ncbi:MAG TPA: tetratricopeptide repeat protein [Candidatus Sulfotelmatobacter sp.]
MEVECARRDVFSVALLIAIVLWQCLAMRAQVGAGGQPGAGSHNQSAMREGDSGLEFQQEAERELQTGTALTLKGLFHEAIPHLLAARGRALNEYAATFNLALCYVGTNQFTPAIAILHDLRRGGRDSVDIENLLTQAYIGNAQPQEAWASLQKAAALSPQNERLYVFVADACMDHKDYVLGLRVVTMGLQNLPESARLHYERATLLAQLDQLDQAKQDFQLAEKLAPSSEIGDLAVAHERLLEGDIAGAVRAAREAVKQGYENPALLTVLGEALIRSGAAPGQAEFTEAQAALEKAVTQRPNDPASQIVLGRLYLMAGRVTDAIVHLEIARQLEPSDPSIFANLAKAYARHGDLQQEQDALAVLSKLNREQAERIHSAPGDRRAGYAGTVLPEDEPAAAPHR